jgi:acetylornithine deacetylase
VTAGKAAHSSRPESGVNAIYRMARVVQALEAYARRGVGREVHPALGKATLSVGVIRGGEYANVVPDRCEIEVDRRLLPGEEGRRAVAEVRSYLSDAIEEDIGLEVLGPDIVVPGLDLRSDEPLVQAVSAAVKQVTGKASVSGMFGTTHAGPLMQAGIPAVVLGPGQMEQAHTATEALDLNQLEQAAQIYELLMRNGATT